METLHYEVNDHIARIEFNRPDKRNAINRQMRLDLWEALNSVRDDDDVRVVLLSGRGKAFCSGHDLSESANLGSGPTSYDLFTLQNQTYKPFIAAMHGVCAAQGGGMALLSDIRIGTPDLRLGWPQARVGITSVSGPTMFARQVPKNVAMEYLLTGRFMDGEEVSRLGLLNRLVEQDDLLSTAQEFAYEIAQNAPLAVSSMKELVMRTADMPDDQAFRFARIAFDLIEHTEDAREGLAAFNEKRTPVWSGK